MYLVRDRPAATDVKRPTIFCSQSGRVGLRSSLLVVKDE